MNLKLLSTPELLELHGRVLNELRARILGDPGKVIPFPVNIENVKPIDYKTEASFNG